jgi:serine/threonine protein kinase
MDDQFIGSYRVLKKIGAGGMGKVYLAVHQDVPNLKVILKILSDPSMGERFRQEADKLALLDSHPSICRIKHFFTQGEDTVIAMEYIDGITLDDKIKLEGKLTADEALPIISRVLDILEFAHQKGVYHRDIKPGNIMLDQSGQVKVIDFGIAKSKTDPSLTMTGSSCGTPAYMAPEQFTPRDDTDYALVDIYAAGTTLFVMLTGQLPFTSENQFALRDAKLFSDPPKPRSLNPDIPKQVEAIVLKSLDKDPKARYSSASEMKQAIDAQAGHGSSVATPKKVAPRATDMTSDIQLSAPTPSRKKTPLLAGILVAIVAIVLGGYLLFKPGPGVAPQLTPIGDQPITAGANLSFGVTATEADNGIPVLKAANLPAGASFSPESGIFTWTPNADQVGEHKVTFFALNAREQSLKDSEVVNITVSPATPQEPGTLAVSVHPSGDIFLDDKIAAKASRSTSLSGAAGPHVVRVENSGATNSPLIDTVAFASGQTLQRSYEFTMAGKVPSSADSKRSQLTIEERKPIPTQPSQGVGSVIVISRPTIGADIYIDGDLQADKTPYTFRKIPAGRHSIKSTLVLDGQALEQTKTVDVVADSTHRVEFDFGK